MTGRSDGLARRAFTRTALAVPLGLASMRRGLASATEPAMRSYQVSWRGGESGVHRLSFEQQGADLVVATEVDIRLRLAFITVYSWKQQGRDVWRDGRIVESKITTVDDGKDFAVALAAQESELVVDGSAGRFTVDPTAMTDLCIWNEELAQRDRIIDGRTGENFRFDIVDRTDEAVEVGARQVSARRYNFTVEDGRKGSLWFDQDGLWVKADFVTRGQTLTYTLES